MAFSVKDFWSYTDDDTAQKDLVLLLAKPGGAGFSLVNMTKEEFFNIASDMTIKFNPTGSNAFITYDEDDSIELKYLAPLNALYYENLPLLYFTDDGSTPQIQFENGTTARIIVGGGSKQGQLVINDGNGENITINALLDSDEIVRIRNCRTLVTNPDIQYRQDKTYNFGVVSDGGTTDIASSLYTIQVSDASSAISAHTYNMPDPTDGDRVRLAIDGSITTITMATPGAETIQDALTTASGFTAREWVYVGGEGEWKRITE